MKKTIGILLAALLLLSLHASAFAAQPQKLDFPDAGVTGELPAAFQDFQGIYSVESYGALSYNPDVYAVGVEYIAQTPDEYRELNEKYADGKLTAEEIADFQTNRAAMLGACVATNGKAEDVLALFPPENAVRGEPLLLGTAGGFDFYYVDVRPEGFGEKLEAPYADEVRTICESMPAVFQNAKLEKPLDPATAMIGSRLRFTARDLDGKEHTSEELFGANEYTMVNCWGTWCGFCVREMGELAELHRRVQERGCGIVGLEMEFSEDEQTFAEARKILSDNGVSYPNVLVNEDMRFMDDITAFPTSIFVDRDGVVVAKPINGAMVDLYEQTFESLLKSEVK